MMLFYVQMAFAVESTFLQCYHFEFYSLFSFSANCIVMALDEHLPNTDKTILSQQLVSKNFKKCSNSCRVLMYLFFVLY